MAQILAGKPLAVELLGTAPKSISCIFRGGFLQNPDSGVREVLAGKPGSPLCRPHLVPLRFAVSSVDSRHQKYLEPSRKTFFSSQSPLPVSEHTNVQGSSGSRRLNFAAFCDQHPSVLLPKNPGQELCFWDRTDRFFMDPRPSPDGGLSQSASTDIICIGISIFL